MRCGSVSVALALAGMGALGLAGCNSLPPPQTVSYVDLQEYQGRWFEIARLPVSFENNCYAVTATYTLNNDGTVRVENECRKGSLDGPVKRATGKAWVTDPGENAKLKVQFFWPFTGDYWVLMLDPGYEWAVVGSPDRRTLWILSRRPEMSQVILDELGRQMAQEGYPVGRMIRTPQALEVP